jgi:putative DNA primase/helicase
MSSAVRNKAATYHQFGWCPIPVKERSKATSLVQLAPYLKRRATKEELNAWSWDGVGIVTGPLSGILVLDVDGPNGEAKLNELGHPPTPMVRTARGGLHLYFKHPSGDVRTGIRIAPELDVKAAGGYVVAPPSLGPNGQHYEWIVSPEEAALADPPEWLMQLLERPRRNGAAPPVGKKIPPGRRNQELTSLAGTMRRRGMEQPEILAALQAANERRCDPPLKAEEVEKIAASVARYEPAKSRSDAPAEYAGDVVHVSFNGHGHSQRTAHFNLTDLGNAERFVAQHGENVRYCYSWRTWLVWTGTRWERDDAGQVHRLAKQTVRGIYREASEEEDEDRRKALAHHARRSESETRIRAMIELAKSEVPISPDKLDANPWLLNVLNGTIDLRTEELQEHRREDLITKIAPVEYTPDALAPTWAAFLERVLPGEELRRFVQRAAGYSTTGTTSEQCMFIHHGPGANGKSTFQEALSTTLGDYAMRTPTETLLVKRSGGVPNDIARLKGARFVTASETEEGRRLAESLVKDLTGQDTISARFMWAEWFDFKPTHTLHLSTNHRPEIRGTDAAIWRRIRLIPWAVTIPPAEQDRKLADKLRDELPGVLAWIVRGCLEWQREGLQAPEEVRKATMSYRAEMDVLAAFLADCCLRGVEEEAFAGELWGAWKRWCEETGEQTGTQKRFGGRLAERGFLNHRDSKTGRKVWSGLSLRVNWESRAGISLNHSNVRFAGNSERTEPSEPKNNKVPKDLLREVNPCKEGSEGSEGSVEPLSAALAAGESATVEQLQRIRELVAQGRSEYAARVEVLAKGHPVDCECEVCS